MEGVNDPTTGLVHIGARQYDSGLGKFISADPIMDVADPQQWNAYSYANNSPITMSDPTGLRPEDNPGHCLGYQGDCGIDPDAGNGVRGEYSPEQLESWGVLGWQQPNFMGYRLPEGEYNYDLVAAKATEEFSAMRDPESQVEYIWQAITARPIP